MTFFLRDTCIFTDATHKRDVLLPIQYPSLWKVFKKQQAVIWTTEEIDFASDKAGFDALDEDARHFLLTIISFFASSDLLILDNLMEQFMGEVTVPECKAFYALQSFIETIHRRRSHHMLNKFVPAGATRYTDGLNQIASIRAKGVGPQPWIQTPVRGTPLGLLYLRGAPVLRFLAPSTGRTGEPCPGLTFSNEERLYEALHAEFAIEMYNSRESSPTEMVHEVLTEAVALGSRRRPQRLEGINERTCAIRAFLCRPLLSLLKGPEDSTRV